MQSDWRGLIKIVEVVHRSRTGEGLWKANNLRNMLHSGGEQFMLNALFVGGKSSNAYIPTNYYFGLDNRTSLSALDEMGDIVSEPNVFGYSRQSVSSLNTFQVALAAGI